MSAHLDVLMKSEKEKHKKLVRRILHTVWDLLKKTKLPLLPVREFEEAEEALNFLSTGKHIRKVVVRNSSLGLGCSGVVHVVLGWR